MDMIPPFSGFPPAGMQFLADLAENNDRAWFEAHKDEYEQSLLEPAQSFIVALGTKLQTLANGISCDTRTDGRGVLMRIHRDTRFSADKSPYKTRISGLFREGKQKKMESPAFGFQIDATGMELLTGIYKFPPAMLAAYRNVVADEQGGAALADVFEAVNRAGDYNIAGEHFKRVPAGYDPDYKFADLLRYDGLYSFSPRIPSSDMHTDSLVDICYRHYQNTAPLYNWLKRNLSTP
jgi:uncharacterized protein (TIGR02453 family)